MTALLVVLDTNILGVQPPLSGNAVQRLLDAAARERVRVAIPELVVREAANAWADQVTKQLRVAEKTERRLVELGMTPTRLERRDPKELRAQKEAELRTRLKRVGASIPGLPQVDHTGLVERALERRKPFDSDGKDGYRDALLWETVIGLAGKDDVLFVSRDLRAFFEEKQDGQLSPALVTEAERRCARQNAVRLFSDLNQALDEALRHSLQEKTEADREDREARKAVEDALAQPAFAAYVGDQIVSALYDADLGQADVRALLPHRKTQELYIDAIEEVADVKVKSAHRVSDRLLADISARLLVSVDVRLPAAAAAMIDEDDAVVVHEVDDLGESRATALRTVSASFEAQFDLTIEDLITLKLRKLARLRSSLRP